MSTIVTRAGKGAPLTYAEMDANFTNLNTDKLETSTAASTYETQTHASTTYETKASAAQYVKTASNLSDLADIPTARTNLDVPTRTGGNASGSWGIDITGTATTATTANAIVDGAVSTTAKIVDGIITQAKLAHNLLEASGSLSGTAAFELTSIPSWASRIEILFSEVTSGTANRLSVQVGTSTYITTGYTTIGGSRLDDASFTSGFPVTAGTFTTAYTGIMTLSKLSIASNVWIMTSVGNTNSATQNSSGFVDIGSILQSVKINLPSGGTFSGGNATIRYS